MENFKSALSAFLRNELRHKDLTDQLEQALEQTPNACAQLLSYLTDLHKTDRLPLEIYAALKFQIEQFQQKTGYAPTNTQSSWTNLPEDGKEIILEQGTIIQDNYRLIEEVGKGAMGVVWKAIDLVKEAGKSRNPYVAIKFLSQKFQATSRRA